MTAQATRASSRLKREIDAVETHEPLLKAHKFGETQEDFVESQ
jgi:hypothetical protein